MSSLFQSLLHRSCILGCLLGRASMAELRPDGWFSSFSFSFWLFLRRHEIICGCEEIPLRKCCNVTISCLSRFGLSPNRYPGLMPMRLQYLANIEIESIRVIFCVVKWDFIVDYSSELSEVHIQSLIPCTSWRPCQRSSDEGNRICGWGRTALDSVKIWQGVFSRFAHGIYQMMLFSSILAVFVKHFSTISECCDRPRGERDPLILKKLSPHCTILASGMPSIKRRH
jgi:hypothetical protein